MMVHTYDFREGTMRNGKIVIGVMGPTRGVDLHKDAALVALAREIGAAITGHGHVLLTGGQPSGSTSAAVKDAAMDGALTVARARLISVLPRMGNYAVKLEITGADRHLVIHTDFRDERNFVNGFVPDVVLAAGAGAGTFSELAIAHAAGVPIVCMQVDGVIDTIKALRSAPANNANGTGYADLLVTIFKAFPYFDPVRVSADLLARLNGVSTAGDAVSGVTRALSLARKRSLIASNALPYHQAFIGCYDEYERALNLL